LESELFAGETVSRALADCKSAARLVYGGDAAQKRTGVDVVPWSRVADAAW